MFCVGYVGHSMVINYSPLVKTATAQRVSELVVRDPAAPHALATSHCSPTVTELALSVLTSGVLETLRSILLLRNHRSVSVCMTVTTTASSYSTFSAALFAQIGFGG